MEALRGSMFLLIPTETSRLYHENSILQTNAAPNQSGLLNSMDLSHSPNYKVDPKAEVVLASLQSCKQNSNNNSNNNNNNNSNNSNNNNSNNSNKSLLLDANEILLGSKT